MPIKPKDIRDLSLPLPTKCARCGKTLPTATKVKWVMGVGAHCSDECLEKSIDRWAEIDAAKEAADGSV
jgi:hypothetical protein